VALARAWAATGERGRARRLLGPVLAAGSGVPDRIRVQAWLADARLAHASGDRALCRRSLTAALRLAGPILRSPPGAPISPGQGPDFIIPIGRNAGREMAEAQVTDTQADLPGILASPGASATMGGMLLAWSRRR
jgi:hypothetical protein